MAETAKEPLAFEQALKELESLVERMEQGELTLEESLRSFERGVELTRLCQRALKDAEQKVEILTTEGGGEPGVEDFEPEKPDA
ncbi:exodeoxyribonuclease VII small subunit [Natronocella acetinitrilica]|jgi:exodeoxyribonuclease VII small subunit|uniref:Exodeoxyribonuclease 7 small subunit n=1 Tax=Natronocella acetinitrilica TaxID=414046 RepID=A0AAE3G1K4_9GAMM|nr:exodeoxyribonuclease VII small subunit [Natronocella acetinitrilica]MCP1673742.1 exodeoxyribonuclease VII small subunit [Natronocella acetinitrilica]